MRALAEGPGIVVFKGAFADPSSSTARPRSFDALIAEQKAAAASAGDHFAKPGANDRVWGALDKFALRAPRPSPTTTPTTSLALVASAWLGPGYQVTSQVNVVNPGGPPRSPTATTTSASCPPTTRALPGARAPPVTGADPAGRGRTLRHACRVRPDPVPAALAEVPARLPRLPPARVHGVLRGTTSSCPWRRATPRSSTRRCSTPPAPTAPPTSAGWPTCCRSPRRSAGRWSASTGRAMSPALYPTLAAARPAARPSGAAQRRRRLGRGVRLPDQPRPRPAGRRHGPADQGRAALARPRGGLGHRDARRRPACSHRPAPDQPGLTDPADPRQSAVGRRRHSDNRRQPPRPWPVMHRTLLRHAPWV